jgi:hypothetical protein
MISVTTGYRRVTCITESEIAKAPKTLLLQGIPAKYLKIEYLSACGEYLPYSSLYLLDS